MTVLADAALLVGSLLLLLAAVGVVRLPDVFARMHAGGKAATLGLALVLAGSAMLAGGVTPAVKLLLAIVFQFVTAPIAVHALSRAAYRDGVPMWDGTAVDELRDATGISFGPPVRRVPPEDESRE